MSSSQDTIQFVTALSPAECAARLLPFLEAVRLGRESVPPGGAIVDVACEYSIRLHARSRLWAGIPESLLPRLQVSLRPDAGGRGTRASGDFGWDAAAQIALYAVVSVVVLAILGGVFLFTRGGLWPHRGGGVIVAGLAVGAFIGLGKCQRYADLIREDGLLLEDFLREQLNAPPVPALL